MEILFRAKSERNGLWNFSKGLPDSTTPCDPKTIGQYIGRTDADGKKIFAGDIILVNDKIKKVVVFSEEDAAFCGVNVGEYGSAYERYFRDFLSRYFWSENTVRVIGNVYDNADLLKI